VTKTRPARAASPARRSSPVSAATSARERLLQAARDVLADDGLEGLTLRAIARRAGVSHGAPLRHFPSLAALLSAVAADGFARLVARTDDHLAAADRAARTDGVPLRATDRVAVAGRAYLDFAHADPGVFSVTFRPERVDVSDPDYQAQGYRSFQQLVGLVEAAQAEGWRPDEPADALAAVLWSHVHGLAVLSLHGSLGGVAGADMVGRLHDLSCHLTFDTDLDTDVGTDLDTNRDTDLAAVRPTASPSPNRR
jgi:AcrR family transcriptional regulator